MQEISFVAQLHYSVYFYVVGGGDRHADLNTSFALQGLKIIETHWLLSAWGCAAALAVRV